MSANWLSYEETYVKMQYNKIPIDSIARAVNKSISEVDSKAIELGLKTIIESPNKKQILWTKNTSKIYKYSYNKVKNSENELVKITNKEIAKATKVCQESCKKHTNLINQIEKCGIEKIIFIENNFKQNYYKFSSKDTKQIDTTEMEGKPKIINKPVPQKEKEIVETETKSKTETKLLNDRAIKWERKRKEFENYLLGEFEKNSFVTMHIGAIASFWGTDRRTTRYHLYIILDDKNSSIKVVSRDIYGNYLFSKKEIGEECGKPKYSTMTILNGDIEPSYVDEKLVIGWNKTTDKIVDYIHSRVCNLPKHEAICISNKEMQIAIGASRNTIMGHLQTISNNRSCIIEMIIIKGTGFNLNYFKLKD